MNQVDQLIQELQRLYRLRGEYEEVESEIQRLNRQLQKAIEDKADEERRGK